MINKLFIFFVFLVLIILTNIVKIKNENFKDINYIPKKIWMYWDNESQPLIVKLCIQNIKKKNPDWEVIVLNKNNINKYITEFDVYNLKHATTPQLTSDFIRLEILSKYGGVWSDASVITTENLKWLHDIQDENKSEFIGYYIDHFTTNKDFPIIENWFFACTENNKFIKKWKEIFYKMNEFDTVEKYVDNLRENTDIQNINGAYYLNMHVACQYVLQNQMSIDERKNTFYLLKAEDGPFMYLDNNNWNSKIAIETLCKRNDTYNTPIIKLRSSERDAIHANDIKCIYNLF